ncbi:uncharacterized protein Dmoj_GI26113, isoform B [Drosophila mojavensis]|uniref:Uncharacterized protein, isoform B n=1 Tax=Drosophila mojavensis TaxID=7230 RepID=A0A0Q9XB52_DROMO|nr:uncharacterized protein Dmoj_GI26113, isoform B [Drosophila mojavensis]
MAPHNPPRSQRESERIDSNNNNNSNNNNSNSNNNNNNGNTHTSTANNTRHLAQRKQAMKGYYSKSIYKMKTNKGERIAPGQDALHTQGTASIK